MSGKQLYITLTIFRNNMAELRVISASLATSDDEAKAIATEKAINEHGEYLRNWTVVADAYSLKRERIEEAAREVLGWTPPN